MFYIGCTAAGLFASVGMRSSLCSKKCSLISNSQCIFLVAMRRCSLLLVLCREKLYSVSILKRHAVRCLLLLQTTGKLKDQTVCSRTTAFADERHSRSRAHDKT